MRLASNQRNQLQKGHDGCRAEDHAIVQLLDLLVVEEDDEAIALEGGQRAPDLLDRVDAMLAGHSIPVQRQLGGAGLNQALKVLGLMFVEGGDLLLDAGAGRAA